MNIITAIVDCAVGPEAEDRVRAARGGPSAPGGDVGAKLRFEGVVRRLEGGRDLLALDYQTYDPMAADQLLRLARDVGERHGLRSILVIHSRGRVAVGEVSLVLEVGAAHRAEALLAAGEFIDRMKQDVPIWKRPVWAGSGE